MIENRVSLCTQSPWHRRLQGAGCVLCRNHANGIQIALCTSSAKSCKIQNLAPVAPFCLSSWCTKKDTEKKHTQKEMKRRETRSQSKTQENACPIYTKYAPSKSAKWQNGKNGRNQRYRWFRTPTQLMLSSGATLSSSSKAMSSLSSESLGEASHRVCAWLLPPRDAEGGASRADRP